MWGPALFLEARRRHCDRTTRGAGLKRLTAGGSMSHFVEAAFRDVCMVWLHWLRLKSFCELQSMLPDVKGFLGLHKQGLRSSYITGGPRSFLL